VVFFCVLHDDLDICTHKNVLALSKIPKGLALAVFLACSPHPCLHVASSPRSTVARTLVPNDHADRSYDVRSDHIWTTEGAATKGEVVGGFETVRRVVHPMETWGNSGTCLTKSAVSREIPNRF